MRPTSAIACALLLATTACFSQGGASTKNPGFSRSGSLLLSRAVPEHSEFSSSMLAYTGSPLQFNASGSVLVTKRVPLEKADVPAEVHALLPAAELAPPASSVLITKPVPAFGVEARNAPGLVFAFVPPAIGFDPADNETWLEIERETKSLTLNRGKTVIKKIQAEGTVDLDAGLYALQHKQKRPLWYAPDSYFVKRRMKVPGNSERQRYRRGALGQYVLYPTTTFPIHSGPIWTADVGGLRLSRSDLSSIYYMLPIGASIVVK